MSSSDWPRIILHADMDAFYAAIEQLDDPSLRGKPLLVGHPGRRGVVATASYEARPFGVGSAMPMAVARKRCPEAVVVPPRMGRYVEVSAEVMEAFGRFSPFVEPLSLDEAFLDMGGTTGLHGPPEQMGARLKEAVFEATGGLTVSVGVAATKYVAKVASDFRKPDGCTVVPPEDSLSFLWPQPISRLWGLGPKGQKRVEALGCRSIGDVAQIERSKLERSLGSLGAHIHKLANGDDPRPVIPHHDPLSVGAEQTLEDDVLGAAAIRPHLLASSDRIARRLRASGVSAGGVRVKLKTASFRIFTRQRPLPFPTRHARDLYEASVGLLDQFDLREPMRLVGVTAYELSEGDAPAQADLFAEDERRRDARLDEAIDKVVERFGGAALRRGSELDRKA
jgi:DNA polymerase IV